MDSLRRATDRTATELAIRRFMEELAAMETSRAESEARLAQARAKLGEHDQWARNRRDYKWMLVGGIVLLVSYWLPEMVVRGGGNPGFRWFCGYPLLVMGVSLIWLWFTGIWRGNTVEAVKPPRSEVEAAIQSILAELAAHDTTRLARQAELDHHRQVVTPGA